MSKSEPPGLQEAHTLVTAAQYLDKLGHWLQDYTCDGSETPMCMAIEARVILEDARINRDELAKVSMSWLTQATSGLEVYGDLCTDRSRLVKEREVVRSVPCPYVQGGSCQLPIQPVYSRISSDLRRQVLTDLDKLLNFVHPGWRQWGFLPALVATLLDGQKVRDLMSEGAIANAKIRMFGLDDVAPEKRILVALN